MANPAFEGRSQQPIGVFDSGLGGLSVWRAITDALPQEDTLYLADQAHVPYGTRSPAEVERLSLQAVAWLIEQGCKLVVVACNTASAIVLNRLRSAYPDTPFVGLEPAIKPASELTHSGKVGVMATPGTLAAERFHLLLERFANGVEVYTRICPGLVELVEAGQLNGATVRTRLHQYLDPLVDAGIDYLVLGCTHYPFLAPAIQQVVGQEVTLLDPAPAVARQVQRVLEQRALLKSGDVAPTHRFFTSGDARVFAKRITNLLGVSHPQVAAVSFSAYSRQPTS